MLYRILIIIIKTIFSAADTAFTYKNKKMDIYIIKRANIYKQK